MAKPTKRNKAPDPLGIADLGLDVSRVAASLPAFDRMRQEDEHPEAKPRIVSRIPAAGRATTRPRQKGVASRTTKDGEPDQRFGKRPVNAGVIRPRGEPPVRVITRQGLEPLVRWTNPETGKTEEKPMQEPFVGRGFGISGKNEFVSLLEAMIQKFESRERLAERIGVPVRAIFRWQKGLGPTFARMEEIRSKLQELEDVVI